MTRFARRGGRSGLRTAGRKYVRANGGATKATRAAARAISASTGVGGFFSDVSARGIVDALGRLGLDAVLGLPVEAVLAAIIDRLAPIGVTSDEVAIRRTVGEALIALFERYGVEDGGIERLNAMDAAGVEEAVVISVAEYVYQRWMLDLGRCLEDGAVDEREAVKLELEVRTYVTDAVKLDLHGRDILAIDWKSREALALVEGLYTEAYRYLEASL